MSNLQSFQITSHAPRAASHALPRHIAIIMDGNGRWAKARNLPRTAGHKKGADALRRVLDSCRNAGISYLTVYAFSSENWKRPQDEINDLMQLLQHYLQQELQTLHENNIRLRFIGDLSLLSSDIREQVAHAVEMTSRNASFNLTIALSYGSRQELVRAMQAIAADVKTGALQPQDINEQRLADALDTGDLPEPDLLIRTGGEKRLSNFLLWQSAYTELYFTDALWPDFDSAHFTEALGDYAKRERRYGTTGV
jgi:undecaprenyl diphosphate synthase